MRDVSYEAGDELEEGNFDYVRIVEDRIGILLPRILVDWAFGEG